jgi:hypothetical protein
MPFLEGPLEKTNFLLEKMTPLTNEDKDRFAYFSIDAKILPPLRILNPQNIVISDVTSIREFCHFNAFRDPNEKVDRRATKALSDRAESS